MNDLPHWVDSHAHIYLKEFDSDREAMLDKAMEKEVTRIFMPNIDSTSVEAMLKVEEEHPGLCVAMMGLHPCSVTADFEKELTRVEQWLNKRPFCAIGEIGTDLYWDKTFWEQQQEAFRIQVQWARQFNLPVVIHCRESMDATIDMVEELQDGTLTGVFHCFTGTREQADRITRLGFCLGIGGVSTFKNGGLDQVLPHVDARSLLLETDSPYLAPVPYRGKRNEPSYIPVIGEHVARVMKMSGSELKQITSANAEKLFQRT